MSIFSQNYFVTNDCMSIDYKLTPIGVIMFFQDCFAQYMTTKNIAAFDIIDDNMYWVVSEFNVEFEEDAPFWSEKIDVNVWISELKKLRLYADFELTHRGKTFAKGNSCWYILSTETHRPLAIDKIAGCFPINEKLMLGEHTKISFDIPVEKISEYTHKINLGDIDFNNHVNNKSYINIAESTISKGYRDKHSLKNLTVKFIKESFLYDELVCSTYKTDDKNTFIHRITKFDDPVCEIKTQWQEKTLNNDIKNYDLQIRQESLVGSL